MKYYVPLLDLILDESNLSGYGLDTSSAWVYILVDEPPTDFNKYEYKAVPSGRLEPVLENGKVVKYKVLYNLSPLTSDQKENILTELKDKIISETLPQVTNKIYSGFYYEIDGVSYHFSFNEHNQTNLNANLAILEQDPAAIISVRGWDAQNNPTIFNMNKEEYTTLGNVALELKKTTLGAFWDFEENLLKCTTEQEVLTLKKSYYAEQGFN
jgi:hypothetical protein